MSTNKANPLSEESRQRLAAEVLELGESLFELALEARNDQSEDHQQGEAYPIEEIQATSDEFFTALRLLLRIER